MGEIDVDPVSNSLRLNFDELRRLVESIPEERMCDQSPGRRNHPAWTLGHLAFSMQAIGEEIDLPHYLPEDWGERFATGSEPQPDASLYPSRAELIARLDEGVRRVQERLKEMSEAERRKPLPDERYRELFPTREHALVHILGAHFAFHLGQLSLARPAG
jgi:DinB family protein